MPSNEPEADAVEQSDGKHVGFNDIVIPSVEATPVKWQILAMWYPSYGRVAGGIYVETRINRHGNTSYAVVLRERWELSKAESEWDFAPIPSERHEAYLTDHRWGKLDEAISAAQCAAEREREEHAG